MLRRFISLQAGRYLSAALMEGFLAASEAQDQDTFPYLLVSESNTCAPCTLCP